MTTRGEKMLRHKKITAQEKSESQGGTKRKAREPAAEEKIQIMARRYRIAFQELERIASNPTKPLEERLQAVREIHKKKEKLNDEIAKTEAELKKVKDEMENRKQYLKQLTNGKDAYKIKKMLNTENDPGKALRVLLDELVRTRDHFQFALERLTSCPDPEIRNMAFDLIKDNLIAVKLICLVSPHKDIRLRAAKVLAKHKENKYFTKPQQKHHNGIIPLPEILIG